MARGTTLGELVTQLRLEARYDSNPALSLNVEPMMKHVLRTTQEWLYDDYDWPFLKVTRDKGIEAGSRYYDVPTDMNLERIIQVDYRWSDKWLPIDRGISLDHYNMHDSDNDDRADPVLRWDVKDTGSGEQVEVWPIPSEDSTMRFTGIRKITPLIANADIADLDDQVIVLYAAAEILASAKDASAQVKLQKAKQRVERLQGRSIKRRRNSFSLGGESMPRDHRRPTPLVAYVRDA